jgi:leucyl aminopeptidase
MGAICIIPLSENGLNTWLNNQDALLQRWVQATGFQAKPGTLCMLPGPRYAVAQVLVGITTPEDLWALGALPGTLPESDYYIDADLSPEVLERLTIGWALGAYQFTRYRRPERGPARLAMHPACDKPLVRNQVEAIYCIRDLINTPAEDMMPAHLAETVEQLGRVFGAKVTQIVGDDLLDNNFPAIHAVGRASRHPPRLIDLQWGQGTAPKVTLIGKGVCFDSGGLNLKPAQGMRLMKKDMGGAAHAIGLARLIMQHRLPVRLRVLIAAVENAVSGNALRPGDVISTPKGITVEIDNTDAEGRIILSDILAEGGAEQPHVLIDFATLTGAARSALGTDVPALFCNDDALAAELLAGADVERDPLWRLPLYEPYREMLDSKVADIANGSARPFAGAITAALFLKAFVPDKTPWAHLDLMAWNVAQRPGRPEGGEAMGLRAMFHYLRQAFSS